MIAKVLNSFKLQVATDNTSRDDEFKKHYETTKDFVRTTIYWMVRSEVVDDLVQETYLKAWNKFNGFKKGSSFKTWIYRIAKNTVYDYFRKNKKILRELKENDIIASEERLDLKELIDKGLNKLSDNHREAFILFYKLEMNKPEIADLLGISEGTVKSRVHYAKNEFIAFLGENGVKHE